MLLRPRQSKFVDRALAALRARSNTLAVAPTGFGKTVALAAIIGRLLAGGGRALVLQHRQELLMQNVAKFQIINPSLPVSFVDACAKDVSGRTGPVTPADLEGPWPGRVPASSIGAALDLVVFFERKPAK